MVYSGENTKKVDELGGTRTLGNYQTDIWINHRLTDDQEKRIGKPLQQPDGSWPVQKLTVSSVTASEYNFSGWEYEPPNNQRSMGWTTNYVTYS